MTDVTIEVVEAPVVNIDLAGPDTVLSAAARVGAEAARDAAEGFKDDAAATAAAFSDVLDDAGVHARAISAAVEGGITDPERLAAVATQGGYFDFLANKYLLENVTKADINNYTALAVTRAAAAYVLNSAGTYDTVAADTLRVSDLGSFMEAAATNAVTAPSDFTTGWANFGGDTGSATNNTVTAPDGTTTAGSLISGVSGAYRSYSLALSVGLQTISIHLKKAARRYTMVEFSGGGLTGVTNYAFDFDTDTLTLTAGNPATSTDVEVLADGWYRFSFVLNITSVTATKVAVRGSSGMTYASRAYTYVDDEVIAYVWHHQIEPGSTVSTPTTGTRPADAVVLQWAGAGEDLDQVEITYTTGTASFTRADFADPAEIDLVGDGSGAWLSKFITEIRLTPAPSPDYRTAEERADDKLNGLISGAVEPIRAVTNRLAAAAGFQPARVGFTVNSVGPTENGCSPYLYVDADTFYWNGQYYATEAALVSAADGTGTGTGKDLLFTGYIAPDAVDLLGGVTFASDFGGFDILSGTAAEALVSGELELTSSGTNATISRAFVGLAGKAVKFDVTGRRGTAAAVQPFFSRFSSTLGTGILGTAINTTSDTAATLYGSVSSGKAWWVGFVQNSGTVGTSYWDNPILREVSPAKDFPNGCFTLFLEGVGAAWPVAEEVLAHGDVNSVRDVVRVEIDSSGDINLIRRLDYLSAASNEVSLTLGSLAPGDPYRIAVSVSQGVLAGALNGVAVESTETYVGAPGFASWRIGRSYSGETYSGTITKYAIWTGDEDAAALARMTEAGEPDNRILIAGDSYAEASSTGIGPHLVDLGFDVINIAVGGSTFAQQAAALIAVAADYPNIPILWWDGSPNGHTDGQSAIETGLFDDVVAAYGHTRILYVRSGQIYSSSTAQYDDMTDVYDYVQATYGATRVYDPQPFLATLAISDTADGGYSNDQTDLAIGRIPRSLLYDGVHLKASVRRLLARQMQAPIDALRRL